MTPASALAQVWQTGSLSRKTSSCHFDRCAQGSASLASKTLWWQSPLLLPRPRIIPPRASSATATNRSFVWTCQPGGSCPSDAPPGRCHARDSLLCSWLLLLPRSMNFIRTFSLQRSSTLQKSWTATNTTISRHSGVQLRRLRKTLIPVFHPLLHRNIHKHSKRTSQATVVAE